MFEAGKGLEVILQKDVVARNPASPVFSMTVV
jgi:hypothetical protein